MSNVVPSPFIAVETMEGNMRSGFESMVWIKDKNGKEYVCYADDLKGNIRLKDDLTEEEKSTCMDVSELLGTERW